MSGTAIRILHLGDLHLDEFTSGQFGDRKDPQFPGMLADAVAPPEHERVARKISRLLTEGSISGILLSGDLTSRGDLAKYEEAVSYVIDLLRLSTEDQERFHVVPGNHDVNRKLCNADPKDEAALLSKFAPLEAAWSSLPAVMAPREVRSTHLDSADGVKAQVGLHSVNSCVGCGEHRMYPPEIQDAVRAAGGESSVFGEQMDSPAILERHLSELAERIDTAPKVHVVLAHHPLLPQAAPRFDVYTELVNGGHARTVLSARRHPVLYCHGHIHDDPVEIIRTGRPNQGPLVCISAPEMKKGFNVIEIAFSDDLFPLGCIVHEHRLTTGGAVERTRFQVVPFAADRADAFSDPATARRTLELLREAAGPFERFLVLKRRLAKADIQLTDDELEATLVELFWAGLASIEPFPHEQEPKYWKLRCLIP